MKYFKTPYVKIPVTIDQGHVNIGATGDMSINEFINLAVDVVGAYNKMNFTWHGFSKAPKEFVDFD